VLIARGIIINTLVIRDTVGVHDRNILFRDGEDLLELKSHIGITLENLSFRRLDPLRSGGDPELEL
jgi:hypothetical protein